MAIFRGLYFCAFLSLTTVICSEARFWGQFWGRKIRFKSHEYLSKIPIIFLFGIVKKCAVREYPKYMIGRYQAA